jgi:hypothetical protein
MNIDGPFEDSVAGVSLQFIELKTRRVGRDK